MKHSIKVIIFLAAFIFIRSSVTGLDYSDQEAIQSSIQRYTQSWNEFGGKGFGDVFTEDADFVNIFGMHFSGKDEIETRHVGILETFLKNSHLEILNMQFREVQPGVVLAFVRWRLLGFRAPGSDINTPGETREGIFTHVFIRSNNQWEIAATQNTLSIKR